MAESQPLRHCPYTQARGCRPEPRYDTQPPDAVSIASLASSFEDDIDDFKEAVDACSAKVYRGDICLTCGAFFQPP